MPRDLIPDGELHDASSFSANAARYHMTAGIVKAYYPGVAGQSPPSVDVEVGIHDVRTCIEPDQPIDGLVVGQRYREPFPILLRVPVRFPTFAGFAVWGPLGVGDKVTLFAFDLDPSTFLSSGQPSDPPFTRRNSGAHWLAMPGDFTDGGALPDPGNAICFGTPGGVLIAIDGSKVNLGAAQASDAVGVASKIDAAVSTIVEAFNAHTHTSAAPGNPTTPPVTPIAPAPGSVASERVKCEP